MGRNKWKRVLNWLTILVSMRQSNFAVTLDEVGVQIEVGVVEKAARLSIEVDDHS